jgi:hypothetical protein
MASEGREWKFRSKHKERVNENRKSYRSDHATGGVSRSILHGGAGGEPSRIAGLDRSGLDREPAGFECRWQPAPFTIPDGYAFVVTDISIQRLSVVSGPGLFAADLVQNYTESGSINRWSFVGSITQNLERSFTTGIRFTTPFKIDNLYVTSPFKNACVWDHRAQVQSSNKCIFSLPRVL